MQVGNHGIPESFIKEVLERCSEFFDQTEREKIEYEPKGLTDKIRWSKGSKPGDQREFLKLISHPEFHCPAKPAAFRAKLNTGSALNTKGIFGWGKAEFSTGSSLTMKGLFGWGKAEFNSGSALNMKGLFGWP
ncbi:hypothetical protein RJ640_016955 [Escallonia rubra]|uniref:Non-haem dioxygenase N-terminal domain-containing protein n=1 Tax=Escallonia rubra TaxID=112253 RepID=A0AA88UHH6_9ASTE|nr:hypothetical protein RJ640_016955 [Escallonia rubra]